MKNTIKITKSAYHEKICIGTAQFGMNYGISNDHGRTKLSEIRKIINFAKKCRIRYFDTAQSYGKSEAILGELFTEVNILREVKCISKLDPKFHDESFSIIESEIYATLKRLKTDSIWGLLMHKLDKKSMNKVLDVVNHFKKKGLVKNFGVSLYNPDDALKYSHNQDIDIIQVPFNILDRRLIDNNFFNIAKDNGKKIFIRSIFLQGLLFMKKKQLLEKDIRWAFEPLKLLKNFVSINSIDLHSFIIQAVLYKAPSANIIIGVETVDQLIDNTRMFETDVNINNRFFNKWWNQLPVFSDKVLNPSMW